MKGHITTRYYFKTFGTILVVFVKVKLKIGSVEEHLNAIAQVIAECDSQAFL